MEAALRRHVARDVGQLAYQNDAQPPPPCLEALECCICLDLAYLPVRPIHGPCDGGDCAVVMCLQCYRDRGEGGTSSSIPIPDPPNGRHTQSIGYNHVLDATLRCNGRTVMLFFCSAPKKGMAHPISFPPRTAGPGGSSPRCGALPSACFPPLAMQRLWHHRFCGGFVDTARGVRVLGHSTSYGDGPCGCPFLFGNGTVLPGALPMGSTRSADAGGTVCMGGGRCSGPLSSPAF